MIATRVSSVPEGSAAVAHTPPIYVVIGGQPTWKAEAVPALVAANRTKPEELLWNPILPAGDLEDWDTQEIMAKDWPRQRNPLRPRVQEAHARYDKLLSQLEAATSQWRERSIHPAGRVRLVQRDNAHEDCL